MSTYQPAQVPDKAEQLPDFLRRETLALKQSLEQAQPVVSLDVLHAPPKRYKAGDIVFADGVLWNPGSGEGVYVRKSASWGFLG